MSRIATPILDRIRGRLERNGDGCLVWTGGLTAKGYGVIKLPTGGNRVIHRLLWEAEKGPIPEGLVLDHFCHTADLACPGGATCPHRACADLSHLRVVTRSENSSAKRPSLRYQDACKRGHAWTPENTRRKSDGNRQCYTCYRAALHRAYLRRKDAGSPGHAYT